MTTPVKLSIGTAIRQYHVADGCERLRTDADGCGRLDNIERTHLHPPDPQSEAGTLATHSGKKISLRFHQFKMAELWKLAMPG